MPRKKTGYVVFLDQAEYNRASDMKPPFGKVVNPRAYNPRRVSDVYYRIFFSYSARGNYEIFLHNFSAALKERFEATPAAINVNEWAQCITVYWSTEDAWIESNRAPQQALRPFFTANQFHQVGCSPYTYQSACVDYTRYILRKAAALRGIQGAFVVDLPPYGQQLPPQSHRKNKHGQVLGNGWSRLHPLPGPRN